MFPYAPLTPDEPEFFFWLRHARRSQEPIAVVGEGAARVARALAPQELRLVVVGEPEAEGGDPPLSWQPGTLEAFTLPRRAGMVALPAGAFERLLTLAAQRAALGAIRDNLQVGGKLALALAMADVQALPPGAGEWLRRLEPWIEPGSGQTVYGWLATRHDPVGQRLHRHFVFEQVDAAGATVRRWHRTEERAFFWPREVQLLLEGAGLEIEARYGGWNDEPLTAASPLQVWVARKGV